MLQKFKFLLFVLTIAVFKKVSGFYLFEDTGKFSMPDDFEILFDFFILQYYTIC